jgi:predicted RNA-binding protein YlqC (UPF0109 family)
MKHISPADMENFFRRLAVGFTKRPAAIVVDTELVGGTITMTLRPTAADTGSLIGTAGAMHMSLRTVLTVLAARGGLGFHLSPIFEPSNKRQLATTQEPLTIEQIGDLFMATCADLFEKVHAWSWEHDERRSNIYLMIAKNEARCVADAQLGEGLSRIFNAIGHCHGRKIYVNLERAKI